MKFNAGMLKRLIMEDQEDDDNIVFVDETEWDDWDKYQYKNIIFKHGEKHYMVKTSRTGSYYSDYYYNYREDWLDGDELECPEVEQVEVVTLEWLPVEGQKEAAHD